MEKEFEIHVKTPNKLLLIKNRLIRSPVKWIVRENELQSIKVNLESCGIYDFTIINKNIIPVPKTIKSKKITKKNKTTKKKPSTLLEKIAITE